MSRSHVEFRGSPNVRALPDIRRAPLYPATLLSQYDNSPIIRALLQSFEWAVNPSWEIDAFYASVFNPHTAFGWGLDVWGRIVGIDRAIVLEGNPNAFGFFGSELAPFGQGPFYSANATSLQVLSDEAYRLLIFLKAAINISTGTMRELNALFLWLFGSRGRVMVLHVGTMHLRLLFRFRLKIFERALLTQAMTSPIPAGVGYDIYDVPLKTFGFNGSGLMPFGQGQFVQGGPQNANSD